jgi:hypothetical protein
VSSPIAPQDAPLEQHTFACAVCGAVAGQVQLYGPPERARVLRTCFTSALSGQVTHGHFAALYRAIAAGDARAIWETDDEYAAFYCPTCDACYCGEHWRHWLEFEEDGWLDCIMGECPHGHERMLED